MDGNLGSNHEYAISAEKLQRTFSVRRRSAAASTAASTAASQTGAVAAPGRLRAAPARINAAIGRIFRGERTTVTAVEDATFSIRAGERVAFVGPNGAGKSTTIRMLTGILTPTGGTAHVLGMVPWLERRRLAYRVGTVFGQRSQLWQHLPARDTFGLLAVVYELDRAAWRARLDHLADAFELKGLLDRPVRSLSLGERMRCEIVASLLHRPSVIFLDEPTIGLDVTAKAVIRDVVRRMADEDGSTVLLTSHDTGDMEQVCDRVIVINHGRVVIDGPVRDLRSRFVRRKRVTCVTVGAEPVASSLDGVRVLGTQPHRTTFEVDTSRTQIEALVADVLARARLADLTVEDPPMDEIVTLIYAQSGNASGDGAASAASRHSSGAT